MKSARLLKNIFGKKENYLTFASQSTNDENVLRFAPIVKEPSSKYLYRATDAVCMLSSDSIIIFSITNFQTMIVRISAFMRKARRYIVVIAGLPHFEMPAFNSMRNRTSLFISSS
jgi:hypothetical protein